jgi:sortase A
VASRRASNAVWVGLGVLGELFITVGLLLLGFLVWQLWWTDVVGNREQAQAVAGLEFTPAPTATASAVPVVAIRRNDDPPVLAEPAHATTFATFQVPRWTGEPIRPISQGTDKKTVLDVLGIGHYEGTAMPGAIGNFAIAAHRTTFAKPFNRIAELQIGDALVVRTADTWYVYTVTSTQIVRPSDVSVIAPVPGDAGATPSERSITLTTCHPMFSASERYIVHGTLLYWAPVSSGSPAELLGTGG